MPGWTVANDGTLTVALDLEITPELHAEGLAREVVKRIQTYRKESGFEITDRIRVVFENNDQLEKAVISFKDYIASQVLADSIEFAATLTGETTEFDFDEFKSNVSITR